jgi:DNA-binding CsgD family transcriptional regulator
MLSVQKFDGRLRLDPFVVGAAFEHTRAETRVAGAAVGGPSPGQIAQSHALSPHTVRSQFSSIFAQTGTTRRAQLIMLSGLPLAALSLR